MVAKGDDRPAMDLAPPRQETPMLYEFKSRATGTITMTGPVGRKVLEIISECLVLLLAAVVMLYGGVNIMKLTMTQVTASLGIPMGTVYTVLPLSGALIVVYSVLNIIDLATDSVEEHSSTSAE